MIFGVWNDFILDGGLMDCLWFWLFKLNDWKECLFFIRYLCLYLYVCIYWYFYWILLSGCY